MASVTLSRDCHMSIIMEASVDVFLSEMELVVLKIEEGSINDEMALMKCEVLLRVLMIVEDALP